ncbi:MAG: hypothetical protein D6723_03605 [Acidobacteria bacterium]|nr:MAG: hypothetical protein D6723_03605 [Acidobacteriota bacterium]
MEPTTLMGPSNPLGYPAPYWFLVLFKVLGFTLHMIPMNLWYAGIIVAMVLSWRGDAHARRVSHRLMKPMPVIIALGVNFGIVPLLFLQVAYYKVFYPATILMAWPWLAIIVLLTVAYYGVYVYVAGLRRGDEEIAAWRRAVGWLTAFLFLVMGFLFANAFSLMTHVEAWPKLWRATGVAGAPLGIALNVDDPTLWPRWLMMFGLALTTTGAYIAVDAGLLARRESEHYRRAAMRIALKVYTVGLIWFAVFGSWYVFGTWSVELRGMMFSEPWVVLTGLTAIAPGLPWLLILTGGRKMTPRWATLVGGAQFLVIALNAISRQIVQNAELRPYLDVTAERVNIQWSPMVLFLLLFVAGLGVVAWMLRKLVGRGELVGSGR